MAANNFMAPIQNKVQPLASTDVPEFMSNVQTSGFLHLGFIPYVSQQAPHLERWQTTLQQAVTNGRHYV